MITRRVALQASLIVLVLLGCAWTYTGCLKDAPAEAPYDQGTVKLTSLSIEPSIYTPRVTWIGGYVSAVGVNRGRTARLDSSLVWLVYAANNSVHYQPRFGEVLPGGQDLTTTYGGHPLTRLVEDQVYTFWVAKDDIWGAITANPGKVLVADSAATVLSRTSNDTLFLSTLSFLVSVEPIDVYIGIRNVHPIGRLGVINVVQTDTGNSPLITFHVNQSGTLPPDTLLTNMGICSGAQYDVSGVIWEVLAVDTTSGQPQYWTTDVISSSVIAGQTIPGTAVFTAYPAGGLERNKTYYVWIANKAWDQRSRLRSTFNYASATFDTF